MILSKRLLQILVTSTPQDCVSIILNFLVSIIMFLTCTLSLTTHNFLFGHKPSSWVLLCLRRYLCYHQCSRHCCCLSTYQKNTILNNNPATAATVQLFIPNFTPATPSTAFLSLSLPFMSLFMGYGTPSMPYPFGNPFFGSSADPNMFGTGLSMAFTWTKSPPSSLPTNVQCTITEFCKKYDLGKWVKIGLDKLGFRFGDELNLVKLQKYTKAGFRLLEWRQVLAAYRKLKHDS